MPDLKGEARLTRATVILTVASIGLLCFLLLLFGMIGKQRRNQGVTASVKNTVPRRILQAKQPAPYAASAVSRPVEPTSERVQGKLTSGNATSGNAASGNAASGNATSGNATSGMVTSGKEHVDHVSTPSQPTAVSKIVPQNPPASMKAAEEYRLDDEMVKRLQRRAFADAAVEPVRFAESSQVVPIGSMVMPTFAPNQQPVSQVVLQESVAPKNSAEEPRGKRPNPQAEEKSEAKGAETETIGVPPPREQPQFLRNDSVLMKPGDYQWEIGFSYARNLNQSPVGQFFGETPVVGNLRRVNRVLQMPIELRVGLTEDLQGSISLPIGLANQEISIGGAELTDDSFGIGDLSLGLTRLIRQGELSEPNVLGFLSLSIPTGQSSLATSLDDPSIALGRGFYSLTTGLTFTRTFDPLVFFSGFGYQHNFEANFSGVGRLNPGNGGFYRLGVGYAVNSNVSLSTAFTGAFLGNAEINDARLGGTSREPLSLRIAATVVNKQKTARKARTIEPFVNLGLNEDATDTILGVSWTY